MKDERDLKQPAWKLTAKRTGVLVLTTAMIGSGSNLHVLLATDAQTQTGYEFVNSQTGQVTVPMEENHLDDTDDLSNQELFEGYLYQLFYEGSGQATYSFDFGTGNLSQLNDKEKELYTKLKTVLTEIADGTQTSTEFDVDLGFSGSYTASEGQTADNAVKAAIKNYFDTELNYTNVVRMLLADCPYELYWFRKSAGYACSYSYTISTANQTYQVPNLKFRFQVASDYAVKINDSQYNPYEVDSTQVERAKAAKEKADEIIRKYSAESDYDKLCGYRKEICDLNEYNTGAASSTGLTINDPWQLVAVFDGDTSTNVVCEGYAKAFAYLFEKSTFSADLKCYIVTGQLSGEDSTQGAGGHMWNIVTMDDQKNYIVDVTNCDGNSIGAPDQLFLAGMQGTVESGYTFTNSNNNKAFFTYDAETKALFSEDILTLSSESYSQTPKQDQDPLTIQAENKTYGDEAFVLNTNGGSGSGSVSFQVPADNGVLSINGNTAEILGAGTVTITAVKAGDQDYNRATAEYELTVAQKTLTPSITGTVSKSYDGTAAVDGANVNTLEIVLAGLMDADQGKVLAAAEYAYDDSEIGVDKKITATNIRLNGSAAQNYTLGNVTTVSANVGTITEAKKVQDPLSIAPIAGKTYGDEAFALSTEGGSGTGAVSYRVPSDNGVLVIDGETATVIGAGEVTITAVKAGDEAFLPSSVSYVLSVAKKTITPSVSGSVSKKYDGTVSIADTASNTLEIILDGLLAADQEKVTAAADFVYADANTGTNKAVRATNIILSGSAAQNYTLSTSEVSADVGTIEPAETDQPSTDNNSAGNSGSTGSGNSSAGGSSSGSGSSSGGSSSGSGSSSSGGYWGSSSSGGNYTPGSSSSGSNPTGGSSSGTAQNQGSSSGTTTEPAVNTTKTDTKTNPDGSTTTTVTTTDNTGKVTQRTETTTEQITANTTKVTEITTTDAGTVKTETITEKQTDGSTVRTETVTSAANKVTTTQTTTKTDGSSTKVVHESDINTKGKPVAVTTTTTAAADGSVETVIKESVITDIASHADASVRVEENGSGVVTSSSATVSRIVSSGNKAMLTGSIVSQIQEAAGNNDVTITMVVNDNQGNRKYEVKAAAQDLSAGNELYIYQLNASSGEYIMVNAKTYKVNSSGSISFSMNENKTYQLVSKSRAAAINKSILDAATVKKPAVSLKKGKNTTAALSSKLNMENVKRISYTSSKKSVASVTKNGKITAKKAGTAAIKIKIVMKNGSKKTVTMKVSVK